MRVQTEGVESWAGEARKKRADGLRNRENLIAAAKRVFTETGPQAGLETIARQAGVGIGTLYRHFPTRDALIEAVCRSELEQLAAAAARLLAQMPPGRALHEWMRLYVGFIGTNKMMAEAVNAMIGNSAEPYRSSVAQITDNKVLGANTELYRNTSVLITEASTLLLERAYAAGEIHAKIGPRELLKALAGFTVTYGNEEEGWEATALRLVDVLMAGLRDSM